MKKKVVRNLPENTVIVVNNIKRNAIIGIELFNCRSRYFIEKVNGKYFLSGMNAEGSNFNNNVFFESRNEMINKYVLAGDDVYVFDTPEELYRWQARVDD